MRTVGFCEINPYCQAVLRKRWPGVPVWDNIKLLSGRNLGHLTDPSDADWRPYNAPQCDVIAGGFPCQDISNAGLRAGISGERSGLWSELARLVGDLRPRWVIVENVSALLRRGFDQVLGDLVSLGYDTRWDCIPASYIGAPHNRDRIWIVAHSERGQRWQESYGRALGRMGRKQQSVPWDRHWEVALREFRGVDDGSAYRVHRVDGIRNSIVPQIPEMIGRAIMTAALDDISSGSQK
jgi:DNA (cytosine-5)-methyltransferase 1